MGFFGVEESRGLRIMRFDGMEGEEEAETAWDVENAGLEAAAAIVGMQ